MRDHYYDWKKKVLVVCLAGTRSLLQPEKKSSSRLSGGCAIVIMTGKKKVLVICLAGARSLLRPEKKSSSPLSGECAIVITTKNTNDLVVCLVGARSLLRPEKKKIQSSVLRVRNCYYDWKKKSSIPLSGGCAIVITSGKKKF